MAFPWAGGVDAPVRDGMLKVYEPFPDGDVNLHNWIG